VETRPTLATVWLGGCSGCHMSFLDMDERLLELADRVRLVYSPIADPKEFPPEVDITLVEGAVTNSENLAMAHLVRRNSRRVISFGDCAVTGNVTAMRNSFDVGEIIETAYGALSDGRPVRPDDYSSVARLLPRATPLHEVIPVDAYLHGCPPTADQIWFAISELLAGRIPAFSNIYLRYG